MPSFELKKLTLILLLLKAFLKLFHLAAAVRDLWRDLQVYRHDGNSILLSSHMIPGGNRADVVFLLQEGEVTELAGEDVPDLAEALDNAP